MYLSRPLPDLRDRQIGARYWVAADADPADVQPRIAALKAALPLAFRTSAGKIEVYDLACWNQPDQPGCEQAVRLLAPEDGRPSLSTRIPGGGD